MNRKKILLALAALLLIPQVSAVEFADIPSTHPQYTALQYLTEQNIIRGQSDGSLFTPDQTINRAEWAEILVRQSGLIADRADRLNHDCFLDVFSEWYAPAVCFSARQGWIKGYQAGDWWGKFVPTNVLNTGEILVTLSRALQWNPPEGTSWWSGALDYAKNARIVSESVSFDEPITRAQAVEILFRSLVLQELAVNRYDPLLVDLFEARQAETPETPTVPTSGEKMTRLLPFPEQPGNPVLPKGSLYVPVLRFQLSAEKDVTLKEITIRRVSVGQTEDLSRGRLLINGKVVKENPFFSNTNLVVWRGLNFLVKGGETVLLEMSVDFVPNARPILEYRFEVSPADIIFTDAAVIIQGEKIVGKSFSVSPISADKITVTNPDSALRLPFVESNDQVIGRFRITAGAHDVLIKRIRLEDAGDITARTFKNFRLTTGGDSLSTVDKIELNALDFHVSDYLIEAERTRTFTVMADILGAQKVDAIRLFLLNPEDIHAYDVEFNFGTQVDNQFSLSQAWCVGVKTIECPAEGLRKHCSQEDRDNNVRDCEEE